MGTVVGDGVIEIPVIKEIDFEGALKYFEEHYGQFGAEFGKLAKKASFDELMAGGMWRSSYQTVTNCNKLTMTVQFFEDNRLIFHVSFDW